LLRRWRLWSSGAPLLHSEIVFDEGLDDLVDAGVGVNPRTPVRGGVERLGLAGDDQLDRRVGYPRRAARG